MPGTTRISLGPVPHFKDSWVQGMTIKKEGEVFHNGSTYRATQNNPTTEPSFTYDPATGQYTCSAGWALVSVGASPETVETVAALVAAQTRLRRDIGYNAAVRTITLTAGEVGKYVKCATRAATANANFNISAPVEIEACSEVLIKTGYNPSDQDHAALDISVIAIYEEIERTRTVQKKNGNNELLYYEVDEEGNPTDVETTTVTDFPVYIQETYTEQRYLPNNEDRWVAIPDSGYYVANIPISCKIAVSYKPGVSDLDIVVVKHGAFANLTSQLLDAYVRRAIAEALASLDSRVKGIEESAGRIGNATAGTIDVLEILKYKAPLILYGQGAPSSSTAPVNWPSDLPWDGVPVFIGQLYIDLDAADGGLYYAKGEGAVANWVKA